MSVAGLLKSYGDAFRGNLFANYVAVFLGGVTGLVVLPIYARLLGSEAWGGASFFLVIQSVMLIFDLGMGQALPRDLVQAEDSAGRVVLRRYFSAYVVVGGFFLLFGVLLAPRLSPHFGADWGRGADLLDIFRLAIFSGACQLVNGFCVAYWTGVGRQSYGVARSLIFLVFRHGLAVFVLSVCAPNIYSFAVCHAFASCIETVLNVRLLFQLGVLRGFASRRDVFALIFKNRALSTSVLLGTLVSQVDRIFLAGIVAAPDFGRYLLVANFALAFMQLQYPLMIALVPRISGDVGRKVAANTFLLISCCCVLPCGLALIFSYRILKIYLGSLYFDESVLVFSLIVLAVIFNSLYHVIYQYILSGRDHGWLVFLNAAILISSSLILYFGGSRFGVVAGGLAWAAGCFLQLAVGVLWWIKTRPRVGYA